MVERKLSGLPVVSANGQLVGDITNKDVRLMLTGVADSHGFDFVGLTVAQFVERLRNEVDERSEERFWGSHVVRPENNLEFVVDKMHEYHVHRVYVIDEENRPIGVISIKDVLSALVEE